MNAWVRHQVCLELCDVDIESSIETQRGSQRGDDLRQESVQVGVSGTFNVQVATADVIERLVVVHDGDICMLQQRVHAQNCVVWLDDCCGHLWAGPHGETQLGLLAVINRKTLQHEAAKTTAGASPNCVEDHEALQASAIVGKLTDAVEDQIDNFLSNGVVSASKVVGGILFSGDQLFWVKELTIGASADLINHSWFQVHHDTTRDMLAGASLAEEGVERVITPANGFVTWHLAIWLNAVLKAEELPARITNLHTALAEVKAKDLTHFCKTMKEGSAKVQAKRLKCKAAKSVA